jgi:hypothetical protein
MRISSGAVAALSAAVVCLADPAAAQTASTTGGRLELAATASWTSTSALGAAAARMTPNTGLTSFTLFDSSAELAACARADVRIGWRATRALTLAAAGNFARPSVRVRIANDAEGAAGVSFAGATLRQWTIGGRVDYALLGMRFASGRVTPFVMASAGYLRHADSGNASNAGGGVYEAGGGLAYSWRLRPASRLAEIRLIAELRATHTRGGYSWGREARTAAALGAGVSTRWGRARNRGIMGPSSSGRR